MSYGVELGERVKRLLRELPAESAEIVLDYIDLLAQQPTRLSRSGSNAGNSTFNAQIYDFPIQISQEKYRAVLQFKYSQDEQSLHIDRIDLMKE
jgi:hypothetical protein